MAEAKKSPVDRWKLLIGLEHCMEGVNHCATCPYFNNEYCCSINMRDAIAYIYYLEEQLGVTGL